MIFNTWIHGHLDITNIPVEKEDLIYMHTYRYIFQFVFLLMNPFINSLIDVLILFRVVCCF